MRFTRLVSKTLRSDPPEAETSSHRLMLKAGLIYQVAAGVYASLPLGWRSLRNIENIVRQEMDAAGGQELMMPALQPRELWEQTGRDVALGEMGNDFVKGQGGTLDTVAGGEGLDRLFDLEVEINEAFELPETLIAALDEI